MGPAVEVVAERRQERRASKRMGTPKAATIRNGTCQPYRVPQARHAGTPTTEANANADIKMPVACPRRSSGKTSPMMARAMPPRIPPKAPVTIRDQSRVA